MLSIVLFSWNRPATILNHSLWTLSHQSTPPLEIIVVDTSCDKKYHEDVGKLCKQYPLVRFIPGRWTRFNISRGFNVGIRAARGEYVATSCMELFFSASLIESLLLRVGENKMNFVRCGCLGPQVDVSAGPEYVRSHWPEYCSQIYPNIADISPGALICASRHWWYKVHGYDEDRCPYRYPDTDIQSRALRDGLLGPQPAPNQGWPAHCHVPWTEAQVLHPYHPRINDVGGIIDRQAPIVRNLHGWGDIRGDEPRRDFKPR